MQDVVDVILRMLLWDWRETGIDDNILCLSYAPSCDVIAVGCESGKIFFIDAQMGENILCPVSCGDFVYVVCFSPDGQHIAAACDNGGVYIFSLNQQSRDWEIRSESPLRVDGEVSSLDISPCGTKIAATCNNYDDNKYEIKMFNLNPRSRDWEIQSESTLSCDDSVYDVSFSPDGQHIAAAYCDGGVYIFSLNQHSQDWKIRSESPLRGHRYVPSHSREYFLSYFRY
jgi:WD40 repeat protein